MNFYKIGDDIVISEGELTQGDKIVPNTTDAAGEKHVPVISQDGARVTVKVGSVEHPMLPAHWIQWIVLQTKTGYQKKKLTPEDKPEATFTVSEDVLAAYEFCNLHGLWKSEL
ncbi:MAG: desulfoferrodoxin family protein [Planctomycetia bacterium]|nr:desulfoferrodoxin family protein [Planctomycetia bacterium]